MSLVEPSTSVKTKVTVPAGSARSTRLFKREEPHGVDPRGDVVCALPKSAPTRQCANSGSPDVGAVQLLADLRDRGVEDDVRVLQSQFVRLRLNVAARIAALAEPSEILVSQTVKDLVAGSGLRFHERGSRQLKGVEGAWHLYAVAATMPSG